MLTYWAVHNRVHLYPLDGRSHEWTPHCWCEPELEESDPPGRAVLVHKPGLALLEVA